MKSKTPGSIPFAKSFRNCSLSSSFASNMMNAYAYALYSSYCYDGYYVRSKLAHGVCVICMSDFLLDFLLMILEFEFY